MATSNNSLRVTELDFNTIKNNLVTFLQNQDTFQDYNFQGSGLSVLLDILAYNTYYNSFYMNMIANEAFLDTAQDRKNILSHAKTINYIPSSARGPEALVNVKVTPSFGEDQNTNYIILDQYTRIMGSDINGTNYPFVTINANSAYKSNGSFYFPNVYIKQGEVITHQFAVNSNNSTVSYQIPSSNVDTSTLIVTVQESSTNTMTTQYFLYDDITQVQSNTAVYYIEENQDLNYTIYFGDNVLGKKPANGNIVIVTYLDTVGAISNGITKFAFTDPIASLYRNNVKIQTITGAYGGTDKEDLESIRFRAPFFYTTQNRAITQSDYESLILKKYPYIQAVSVWGGEQNDPVVYGSVFISLKTQGYYALTQLEKQNIINDLTNGISVLTVTPQIVDPNYCFLLINGKVTYNPNLTTNTSTQIEESIFNSINSYQNDKLNTFQSIYKLSKLQQYIESSDASITGSDIYVYLQSRVTMMPGVNRNYVINYSTPIRKGDLVEKMFTYPQVTVLDSTNTPQNVFFEEVVNSSTGVSSIVVQNKGTGYTSPPTIIIEGDGTGATATASLVNGQITGITITNAGYNYTRASVVINGVGVGATAEALVQGNYGTVRSYYYQSNGQKIVVNPTAGTIDYVNGIVTLTSLNVSSVVTNSIYNENILTVNVPPENEIISPVRNLIFSVDMNNPQSIQLTLTEGL